MKNGFFMWVLRLFRQRRGFWPRQKRRNSPVSEKGRLFVMQMRKSLALGASILLLALSAAGCGGKKNVPSSSGVTTRSSDAGTAESTSGVSTEWSGEGESPTSASEGSQDSTVRPQGGSSGVTKKQTTTSAATKASGSNTPSSAPKKTIRLLCQNTSSYYNDAGVLDVTNPFVKQISAVENALNVKIELKQFANPSTIAADSLAASQAGDVPFDISMAGILQSKTMAARGIIADLKSLGTVDTAASQYNKALSEMFTYHNKTYGVFFGWLQNTYVVYYNRELLSKYYKGTDPYTLYTQGKWDWQAFEAIAKACTVQGKNGNTVCSGVACDMYLNGFAIASNTGGTVSRDARGNYTYGMIEQAGIDATTWVKSLYQNKYWSYENSWRTNLANFAIGQVAMLPNFTFILEQLAESCDFDYGIVPFPKGPEAKKHNITLYDSSIYMIHTNSPEKKLAGSVLQMLSQAGPTMQNDFLSKAKGYGLDANSIKVLGELNGLVTPEFCIGVPTKVGSTTGGAMLESSITTASKSPATVAASIYSAMYAQLFDYYKNNFTK